jgi:hypothetical protein
MQFICIITQLTQVTSVHKLTSSTSSVTSYYMVYNFKMINLTYIVLILSFIFTIVVYVAR